MKQLVFVYSITILFCITTIASAQIAGSDISVATSPAIAGPVENVRITLSSFSTDLNRADITWYVDGTLKLSGTGKTELSVTTGAVGSRMNILATIDLRDGTTVEKNVVLAPSEVDLLYEAPDSYVPPFYRGKALIAKEASIKVTAIPNIKVNGLAARSDDLVYTWKNNYDPAPDNSGYGKQSYTFRSNYLHPTETISVGVSSLSGGAASEGQVTIVPTNPEIVLYENNLAEGTLYNRALSTGFVFSGSEMGVLVAPYFFSPKNATHAQLKYSWALNDQIVATPAAKNLLVLRKNPEDQGLAKISVGVENIIKLFQSAGSNITITLENNAN